MIPMTRLTWRFCFPMVTAVALVAMLATASLAQQPKGRIKALTFDVYGTLVSWEGIENTVAEVFRTRGITADPKAFNTAWRTRQLLFSMYNTMMDTGYEPFIFLTRKALLNAAAIHNVRLAKEDEDRLVNVWMEKIEPYPDVLEGLQQLKRLGYAMAPLTNGNSEMVRIGIFERFAQRGFTFDSYFTSDLWGKYKPHPDIYLKSVARFGFQPEEVIHVCRVQLDVQGGKAAGLKVAWVNRAQEPLETYGYRPDWTVRDFLELAKLLEQEKP
jgi:2-haloacid dehalogenase